MQIQEKKLTTIIRAEEGGYVALCPEVDVASQGNSVEEARKNLVEALELFFECASENEISDRLQNDVYISPVNVAVG